MGQRLPREPQRDKRRADSRGRPHLAKTFGADVQDIASEDRQKRGCPAQQDGEQIQSDAAKQEAFVPDEAKAFHDLADQ